MDTKNKKSIFRIMLSVSGIVILAKVLGFIKQMVSANAFGATVHTDLIFISEGLVVNIDYLLVQTLATAFIPSYIYIKTNKPDDSKVFVSNVIKVFFTVTTAIAVIVACAAPLISRVLAPSYSEELSRSLANYLRVFSPSLVVIVELAVFNSLLKANEVFVPGEMVGANQSIILILLILLLGSSLGPDTLVVAFYAYGILNLVFLMVYSRKHWRISRGNPFKDPDIRKMLAMMGPLLLGYSVVFVNQQVDKIIVSGLGDGIVTAMSYAAVLSNFVSTFIGSLCGVLFTYITKNVAEKKDRDAAVLTMKSVVQMITLFLPISVLTIANAHDIVSLVFGRGQFNSIAVSNCSTALIGYGGIFVPFVLRELFSRFQYAYGDSKNPMINSTIAIAVNIILSLTLSLWLGVLGVTLATSISVLVCALLNFRSSKRRNQHLKIQELFSNMLQWVIGSFACIAVTFLGQRCLSSVHVLIRFSVITIISLGCYALINLSTLKPLLKEVLHR